MAAKKEGFTSNETTTANAAIAEGMAFVLGLWFLPVPVVGSVACNAAEMKMVRAVLTALNGTSRQADADALFWFFRKRYFVVNVATFVPYAGPAVQLLEAFGLGRFVMICCERDVDLSDEKALSAAFDEVEPALWDSAGVITFYEQTSGGSFPDAARGPFIAAVSALRSAVNTTNRIPGARRGQELAGEAMRSAAEFTKGLWIGLTSPAPTAPVQEAAVPTSAASATHAFNDRHICVQCGSSKGAIDAFAWTCRTTEAPGHG